MRVNTCCLIAMLVACAGCSSSHPSVKPATAERHPILKTLATRDRNAVHVALWTLSSDEIPITRQINLESPYSEARPGIQAIIDEVRNLPEARLEGLDKSLAYHWRIYSPIWSSEGWP